MFHEFMRKIQTIKFSSYFDNLAFRNANIAEILQTSLILLTRCYLFIYLCEIDGFVKI